MSLQFTNNASTTLSGSINDTQTSITVVNSTSFPSLTGAQYFYATMYELSGELEINIEIIKVTATSGSTWTVDRAQDGTTGRSRSGVSTCYIELRLTAAGAGEMLQKSLNLSDLQSASTARTNLGLGTLATQNANAVAITGGSISGVTIGGIDSTTTISDNADNTKKVAFEVSSVATGTTRTLTVPNASGTIALVENLTAGYQPLDSDLTAVAALAANGLIARTGTGAMAIRAITQPAAGITVTNGDGVSGNPTLALANDLAAVEAISATGFVRRTAADTWSAAPIADGDLPSALTGKTYNALTLTANATGFSLAGGTSSKSLTVSSSITLAGTDGTTITMPSSTGTVALNNQTFFIGTTQVAINRASASLTLNGVSIDGSAGSATTATSSTTASNLAGGNGTTLLGSIPYQSGTNATTLLAPNTTTNRRFLRQTGTGTNGAAPAWDSVTASDVGLGNVENTALSTWAGSANIATLGTITTGTWNGTAISIARGGTGQTTAVAAFDALAPTTTLGDMIFHDGTDNVRLAGNTTATRRFIRQVGDGVNSAAPAWDTLVDGDIPTALTGKTYNGLTLTAASVGFTVAGGATSKTLTVNNTLTLSGTDSATLNIGGGGTLGSAAFTASTAYSPVAGSASITTLGTISSGTWQGSAIGISYGGTGQTSKTAGFNALSPVTTLGDLIYGDGANSNARLAGNTTTAKQFLTQTGNGTISAAPAWAAIVNADVPSALTGKTYNGLSLTAAATGFTVAGGTTSKTLTVSNTLTLAGTDASTLNIGAGGTLGSAAFTASTAYAPAAGSASIVTIGTITNALLRHQPATNINLFAEDGGGFYSDYAVQDDGVTYIQRKIGGSTVTLQAGVADILTASSSGIALGGTRITGDFSNGTLTSRLSFQSSTTNGVTALSALPNGTATTSYLIAFNNATPTNASFGWLSASTTAVDVSSGRAGSGTFLPLRLLTSDTARVHIAIDGKIGLGQTSPATTVDVSGAQASNIVAVGALNIDCAAGNYFTKTISANSTFTVSNVPASRAYSFTLELTHTSGTVTWFTGVQWPGGTAPTLTTGKTHLFMFVTDDGGTRWRASSLVNYTN